MELSEEVREWLLARELNSFSAAKKAKFWVLRESKERRDTRRYGPVRDSTLRNYTQIKRAGRYLSWGFGTDSSDFDEYFGEVDLETSLPHGMGVKYYSDGSIYVGGFKNGEPHCAEDGLWSRKNGLKYEGGWLAGRKHGVGNLVYPSLKNAALYKSYSGQFANGMEHGQGVLEYADLSVYRGRVLQ